MQYTKYVHQLLSGKNVLIDFELIIPEIVDRSSRAGFLKKNLFNGVFPGHRATTVM